MISFALFIVVLLALYLAECVVFVQKGSIAFRESMIFKRRTTLLTKPRVNPVPGIALAFPFVGHSDVLLCSRPPFALSPTGIAIPLGLSASQSAGPFLRFENILSIESAQNKLVLNRYVRFATASKYEAELFAGLLNKIKQARPENRAELIARSISDSLSLSYADSRLDAFETETSIVRAFSSFLVAVFFILTPVAVWRFGIAVAWPFLAACVVTNILAILWAFLRSCKELRTRLKFDSAMESAMICLSPIHALRATKSLALYVSAELDPLAIAAARGSRAEFLALASVAVRTMIPDVDSYRGDSRDYEECARWYRERFEQAVARIIRTLGLPEDALHAPPNREALVSMSYCPRCHSQYVIATGVCDDCGGVPLRAF
jgi:hypothetical protein